MSGPVEVIDDQKEINRFAALAFDRSMLFFAPSKISRSSIAKGIISDSERFDRYLEDTLAAAPEPADKVELL